MKPITTEGTASSTSGAVTTQGDSWGVCAWWSSWPWSSGGGNGLWRKRSSPWKTRKYIRNE